MLIRRKSEINIVLLKMHDSTTERQRGKAAINAAHTRIAKEDEARISALISDEYGVDSTEALEIHTNYHVERIISALEKRARENGMGKDAFDANMQHLDIANQAYQVAMGQLAEAAAVDIMFRDLYRIESKGGDNDRYVNFYG